VLIVGGVVALAILNWPESDAQKAADAAVTYGRTQMVWDRGPRAASSHIVPMRDVTAAVTQYASPGIASHFNARVLVRQYGPDHRVAVVVLTGSFNSLPPDEGVTLTMAVALVDVPSGRVILVID
jgi:hypothetical protein